MPKQARTISNRNDERIPNGRTGKASDSSDAINAEDERDVRDARRSLKEAQQKGSIPWETVKREVGI
jgi:hypothetical protein